MKEPLPVMSMLNVTDKGYAPVATLVVPFMMIPPTATSPVTVADEGLTVQQNPVGRFVTFSTLTEYIFATGTVELSGNVKRRAP